MSTGRKLNYCVYCSVLVKKFARHVQTHHGDEEEGRALLRVTGGSPAEKRQQKTRITDPIRKKWNSIYNEKQVEKGREESVIVVKRQHGGKPVGYVKCVHCEGQYRRDKLSVHLRLCAEFLSKNPGRRFGNVAALKKHSLPNVPAFVEGISPQFVKEILTGINEDVIMKAALRDSLIMKFGSIFHESRREPSGRSYIIREIRDLTRLLLKMKAARPEIRSLRDCFNPKYFETVAQSALSLARYNSDTGSVGVPSVAYRLSQPIKDAANIARTDEIVAIYERRETGRYSVTVIEDFLVLMNGQWKNRIGRICTKAQKRGRAERTDKITLEEDIVKMASHIEESYGKQIDKLHRDADKCAAFNLLTHMLVTHIMLLIRRRPVDFKHATVSHYGNLDKHDELLDMVGGMDGEDLEKCKRFHLFYVPGKNLDVVPMVLTPQMKAAMDALLRHRTEVGVECDALFALAGGRLINPTESLSTMKRRVALKRPDHFSGNGLRHQAATFSRLHSSHPQYQDYLASALGHTLAVHKKHYDLPLGVLQKIMVCPILHNIMTNDKRRQAEGEEEEEEEKEKEEEGDEGEGPPQEPSWREEPRNEAEEEEEEEERAREPQSEAEEEEREQPRQGGGLEMFASGVGASSTPRKTRPMSKREKVKKTKRRWTFEEQKAVMQHFGRHILEKRTPARSEVVKFMSVKRRALKNRTIAQVLLFIRNHSTRQQLDVTLKVEEFLSSMDK